MKVTVIYGQSHKGMTWSISQLLLEYLDPDEVEEFMLPRDGPPSCIGCNRCFFEGEERCPHKDRVSSIVASMLASDVIVLASPNYVDGMTGAMKDLMDHLVYTWMSHRPNGEMFTKTAVVIASSAGAGNGHVLGSMEKQLRSWMVPKVHRIGLVSHAYGIDDLSDGKARKVDRMCSKVVGSILSHQGKVPFSIRQRFMFHLFRSMQSGSSSWNETDTAWWRGNGWLEGVRPWRDPGKNR